MAAKTRLTAINGQATLESVLAALAFVPFVVMILACFYFLALKAHLQFTSHELLICREFKDPVACDFNFRKELQSFLSFGRIESLHATRRSASQSLELVLQFQFPGFERKDFRWTYKDSITLPLQEVSDSMVDLRR